MKCLEIFYVKNDIKLTLVQYIHTCIQLVLAFNYNFILNRRILSRVSRANSHNELRDSKLSWHIAVRACFLPLKACVYIHLITE